MTLSGNTQAESSKPKVIVHIGTPKTGTTTIQAALYGAQDRLLSECQTLFASTARNKAPHRHTSISAAVKSGGEDMHAEFSALMKEYERSGARNLFVTDEALSFKGAKVSPFFNYFVKEGFEVDVVCYLRRWDYFAESFYNQMVRLRHFKETPPIDQFWKDQRIISKLNYSVMLADWEDIATNMIVRDFHKEVSEVGLLESFQKACGFEALGELEVESKNQSRDARVLVTLCHCADGNEPKDILAFAQTLSVATSKLLHGGVIKPYKYILGRKERDLLIRQMRSLSGDLVADYGIDFNDDRPNEPDEALVAPPSDYLLALLGELSVVDTLYMHKLLQNRLFNALRYVPESTLLEPAMLKTRELDDWWISALDDAGFGEPGEAVTPVPAIAAG